MRPSHLALPEALDQLILMPGPAADMLVGRISCVAGSTGGTLRGSSGIFLLELREGAQPRTITADMVM